LFPMDETMPNPVTTTRRMGALLRLLGLLIGQGGQKAQPDKT
jgi:hypothetical protein